MRSHLRTMAKRKASDFLLREEGMVGNRSGLLRRRHWLVQTALAMSLLVAPRRRSPRVARICNDPTRMDVAVLKRECLYCTPGTRLLFF